MCWKKAKPVYPGKYYQWVQVFEERTDRLLDETDVALFQSGALSDAKANVNPFIKELIAFEEAQMGLLLNKYSDEVRRYLNENDIGYFGLIVKRNDEQFKNLLFFEKFDFLSRSVKCKLREELTSKFRAFISEVTSHLTKAAQRFPSAMQLRITLDRLYQGQLKEGSV